ncbi:hypothetical protein BGX34_008963 [Mortierella sp. NVP85]|nr:hypothetical protein BGX34_008963 [Mortierella sp. NVP85]
MSGEAVLFLTDDDFEQIQVLWRIRGSDDSNHSLIMDPRDLSQQNVLQQIPTSLNNPFQLRSGNNMAQAEDLHPVQLQMEELAGRVQQADQKMDELVGSIQQTD